MLNPLKWAVALMAALSLVPAAQAQTMQDGHPVPPDVSLYQPVAMTWATGTDHNVQTEGVVTPPAQAGLSPLTSPTAGWVVPTGPQCVTTLDGGTCTEAKFRTHANVTKVLYDDPIRNWGQPGGAHCHIFFGNVNINAFSTYSSLRTNNQSFAAGGIQNATGYWYPCPTKDGKAVKARHITIYYAIHPAEGKLVTVTPPGLRYILGYDMDEPDGTKLDSYVAAANAANGGGTRYKTHAGSSFVSPFQYVCEGGTTDNGTSTWGGFTKADGSDPWNGTCTTNEIIIQAGGPSCWDGVNLWSPSGYDHVVYPIFDTLTGEYVCPSNWYRIPSVLISVNIGHDGPADYTTWVLDSDQHAEMVPGAPTLLPGGSFHTDWMDGWNPVVFRSWQENCIGAEQNIPKECNNSSFSESESLIVQSGSPDGRYPQVELSNTFTTSDPEGVWELPAQQNGPVTIHVHGD